MSAHADCLAGAIDIEPDANIAHIVAHAPKGAAFCIHPGVYRMQAIAPKTGQQFYGLPGAVLNGARLIETFEREGEFWVATGQTQRGYRHGRENCIHTMPRCDRPDAFFIDDQPLLAVAHKEDVVPGRFFFDYPANKIYFVDDPTGKTVEASVSPYAFFGSSDDVLIEGLIVEKYSAPIQSGAVGANGPATHWRVRHNEMRLNYALGVSIGARSRLSDNFIHDNGEMGIGCSGRNILIDGNEIAHNGYFSGLDPFWEGGGGKCAETDGLIVRGNTSHDNNGPGFWTDIDNINTLYEGNRIEHNRNAGISHEISYAAVIRNNTFKNNGFAFDVWLWGGAIQIQNSRDVEVYGNTVDIGKRGNGITVIHQDRGTGKYGQHDAVNNYVHDNHVTMHRGGAGVSGTITDFDPRTLRDGNNRFDHNTYTVPPSDDDHWAWVNDFFGWRDYRRKSGQDAHSDLIVAP
jgi:parallel beta-helix repeat protein